jgi:hypothetical protein
MPSSNTITYDQNPPHRPGTDDVGGAAKVNARRPPDPQRALTAEDINQLSKQIVEIAGVSPVAILVVVNTGTPTIESVTGMGSAAKNPSTYTLTDLGVGHTRISWPANTFPARIARHTADISDTTGQIATTTGVNQAEVYTEDAGGGASDKSFVLFIMGQ